MSLRRSARQKGKQASVDDDDDQTESTEAFAAPSASPSENAVAVVEEKPPPQVQESPIDAADVEEPAEIVAGPSRDAIDPALQEDEVEPSQAEIASASPEPSGVYELFFMQQPEKAMAAGLSPMTLGRLPVLPVPVLQLFERTDDANSPYNAPSVTATRSMICSCSLLSVSVGQMQSGRGDEPIEYVDSVDGMTRVQALVGQLVSNVQFGVDWSNQKAAYLVFDVSVRQAGRYKLRCTIFEARHGATPVASAVSNTFEVYERNAYPGDSDRDITHLTQHLDAQGIKIYMPALSDASALL